jgi:hypothetical protein
MPTDRELDDLIDAALPSYSAAEPRPGLQHRIIAHALAQPHRRKRLGWAWAFAVPAIACLLLFILPRHHTVPQSAVASGPTTMTPPSIDSNIPLRTTPSPVQAEATHIHSAMASHPATHEPLPKQNVFPSPSPLTAEEQALVAYNRAQLRATTTIPDTELEINPIHVAELQIKPITILALDLPASSPTESGRNDQQP